jgi:predicted esterase
MPRFLLSAFLLLSPLLAQTPAPAPRAIQREVLRVTTRPGVVQPCLLLVEAPSQPKALALMFPGGSGVQRLGERPLEEVLGPTGNFLVRSAERFLSPDLAVAILDCPSDRAMGMNDGFRASAEHARDVSTLLGALRKRFSDLRVILVGTSRGTVSAAYVAQALGSAVEGVVLSSSVFLANKRQSGLSGFRFQDLAAPFLLVHHAEDGCAACPYSRAEALAGKAILITVRGSIEPESGPCDPLSNHGYFGREAQVSQAIRAWILGQPFEREIP